MNLLWNGSDISPGYAVGLHRGAGLSIVPLWDDL